MPRLRVTQTSREEGGQIYIGAINWLLFLGVLALILTVALQVVALAMLPAGSPSLAGWIVAVTLGRFAIALAHGTRPLVVTSPGAPALPYVAALHVDGREVTTPYLEHSWIADGADVAFTMSATPTDWGTW